MTKRTWHTTVVVFCVAMAVLCWAWHATWWEAAALWLAAPALLFRAWSAEAELTRLRARQPLESVTDAASLP